MCAYYRPVLITGLLVTMGTGCGTIVSSVGTVTGSGITVTEDFSATDFSKIEIRSAFRAEVEAGDKYSISITADDNLMDMVRVEVTGKTLVVDLDVQKRGFGGVSNATLVAKITIPKLEAVKASGASKVVMGKFPEQKNFTIDASGAGGVDGPISTDDLKAEASGASTVKLTGIAQSAKLTANGASKLNLGDLKVDKAKVSLSGASSANLNVLNGLDYDISGASQLHWKGTAKVGTAKKSGAASAGHE